MRHLRGKLSSYSLKERIIWTIFLFFIVFFGSIIISYFLLPEGLLKNKNPLQNWDISDNILILILQIFFHNLISVIIILLASLFANKKAQEDQSFSVGYMAFFTLICINGITLGTWSFSINSPPVPLFERIIYVFDLAHKAAIWEMTGQLLITCATAHIFLVESCGKETKTRKIKELHLTKPEKIALITGIIFMLIGAIVESISINALQSKTCYLAAHMIV